MFRWGPEHPLFSSFSEWDSGETEGHRKGSLDQNEGLNRIVFRGETSCREVFGMGEVPGVESGYSKPLDG